MNVCVSAPVWMSSGVHQLPAAVRIAIASCRYGDSYRLIYQFGARMRIPADTQTSGIVEPGFPERIRIGVPEVTATASAGVPRSYVGLWP